MCAFIHIFISNLIVIVVEILLFNLKPISGLVV